ncbi:MAG: AAA family ATPase, partial [Thermoflexibacter sp.]|nr:AAA family ATPase [Thermoflexibacter sp.]
MKVSRIEIKDFQQFKDFTLDLTYPKGHELEGQPLKKVCIIGQSGTGKTTILNVICDLIESKKKSEVWENRIEKSILSYKIDYFVLGAENKGFISKYRENETNEFY